MYSLSVWALLVTMFVSSECVSCSSDGGSCECPGSLWLCTVASGSNLYVGEGGYSGCEETDATEFAACCSVVGGSDSDGLSVVDIVPAFEWWVCRDVPSVTPYD